jgi:hypothetical protein
MTEYALNFLCSRLRDLETEKQIWKNQSEVNPVNEGVFELIDYEIASIREAIIIIAGNCDMNIILIFESKMNNDVV